MKILDNYFGARQELFKYFNYVEDWRVLPIDDCRDYFWRLEGTGPGAVHFAETEEELENEEGNYFINEIYTQRHLNKWVYRAEEYTMVVVDTNVDGNKFLSIFDNNKERN